MALKTFNSELGFGIFNENGDVAIKLLRSAGAPDGTSTGQADAPIGSILMTETGEFYKKIADADVASDWKRMSSEDATDMFITAGIDIATNGTVANGDSVEEAFGKLQANQDDLLTALGVAQGDVDMGTFTGSVISDNVSAKVALQELETFAENIAGGSEDTASGITTPVRLGAELVDNSDYCEYEIMVKDSANPENKEVVKIGALHDGSASADATVVDYNKFSKLRVGASFNVTIDVTLSGAGAAQDFAVEISSTEISGVDAVVRKVCI